MEKDKFRFEILKKEIEVISDKVNHFDDLRLKTRQMAIILWVAIIGFNLKNTEPSDNIDLLFLLAAFIPIPFWYIEASYRRHYEGWYLRFKAIRKFIRNGKLLISNGNTPELDDFLDESKPTDFPLFDYWGQETIAEKYRKMKTNKFRNLFKPTILMIYYPMVLIGLILGTYKTEHKDYYFLFLSLITVSILIISIIYSKIDRKKTKELKTLHNNAL